MRSKFQRFMDEDFGLVLVVIFIIGMAIYSCRHPAPPPKLNTVPPSVPAEKND